MFHGTGKTQKYYMLNAQSGPMYFTVKTIDE